MSVDVATGTIYFSVLGSGATIPGVSGTTNSSDVYSVNSTGTFARVWDATANGLTDENVDGLSLVDSTHFYLSFAAASTFLPDINGVGDSDVVYYEAGTWWLYLNGTAAGLTSNQLDIDALDIPTAP